MNRERFIHLAFGMAFGVAITKNGAADFDSMMRMFRFEEFLLFGVAIVTTLGSALGLAILQRQKRKSESNFVLASRPIHRGSVVGAVIFGVGWAVSGTCPGTAAAQLGQGHFIALATIAGIFVGSYGFDVFNRRKLKWALSSCD